MADRLRQFNTRFGVRSRRVFLVWVQTVGEERGEGPVVEVARREILPTPDVSDATAVTRRPIGLGIVPEGTLRVTEISARSFTEDNLRGLTIPLDAEAGQVLPDTSVAVGGTAANPLVKHPFDFFYEVVEDGRGDNPPARKRFKLLASPWRRESGLQWGVYLEPEMGDADRLGNSLDEALNVLDD